MATPNAVVTLYGVSTPVFISADSTSMTDMSGKAYAWPTNATIDKDNNIVLNNQVIGNIAPPPSSSSTNSTTSTTTPSSTVAGAAATTTAATSSSATPAATSSTTSATTAPVPGSNTHVFGGTRSLEDGGARLPADNSNSDASTVPTFDPNADGRIPVDSSGGGGGGGGPDTSTPNDTSTTPDNPGKWGEGNPQFDKAPAGTYDSPDGPGASDRTKGLGAASALVSGLTAASKWSKLAFLGQGILGKALGIGGVVFGALGLYASIKDLWKNPKSIEAWLGVASSFAGIALGAAMLVSLGLISGPLAVAFLGVPVVGWIIVAAVVVIAIIQALKSEDDNDVDTSKGDVANNYNNLVAPAPPAWAQGYLPNKSVYMILAGVATITLGIKPPIDLRSNGPLVQQELIPASLVPSFNASFVTEMQKDTNTTINGPLVGKIFIKAGDANTPDKAVYVTQYADGSRDCTADKPCEAVNMVSLNPGGMIVSPFDPKNINSHQPFYKVANGAVAPNEAAFNDLGQMDALVNISNGAKPTSSAVQINMAALMGHRAQELPAPIAAPSVAEDNTPPPASTGGY